jgi:hypothetical protein
MCPEMYIGMPFTQGTKYSSIFFMFNSFFMVDDAREE